MHPNWSGQWVYPNQGSQMHPNYRGSQVHPNNWSSWMHPNGWGSWAWLGACALPSRLALRACSLQDLNDYCNNDLYFNILCELFILWITKNMTNRYSKFSTVLKKKRITFYPLWPRQPLLQPPPPFVAIATCCPLTLVVASHYPPLLPPLMVGCCVLP